MSLTWVPEPIPRFRAEDGPYSALIVEEYQNHWEWKTQEKDQHGYTVINSGWEVSEEKAKAEAERSLNFFKNWKKERGETTLGPA